jgi:hypothetical protein
MGRVRGKDWMQEHVSDRFVKRARTEGRRSRAAFKLEEIARRDRLLAPGMTVVDLGAAPGGWSQVAAGEVGPHGRVIALDRLDMPPLAGVTFIRGDFHDVLWLQNWRACSRVSRSTLCFPICPPTLVVLRLPTMRARRRARGVGARFCVEAPETTGKIFSSSCSRAPVTKRS